MVVFFRRALALLCCLVSLSAAGNNPEKPVKEFAHPERVRYDGSCMTIDGRDVFIYSAAFHYFRCPEELWRDRFRKIKAAGFNTVETYVPWNRHERSMPSGLDDTTRFDFSEIRRWLEMAQEEFGLYTIVRPGPFICAEYSGGAYPRWLARFRPDDVGGLWLRSADQTHVRWCVHWFDAVCKALADEQITRKPAGKKGIILIQIENEYNAHGCDNKEYFLKELYRSVRRNGFDVPVFTCLTGECRGSSDKELSQVFDCDNYYVGLSDAPSCAYRMSDLRRAQPDAPGFVTELQGGWFSLVTGSLSEDHYSDERHFKAVGLMSILGGATGLNYYMFCGGTHFEGWGARGMTTSYDYNAAIRESGASGPKYYASQQIGEFIGTFEPQLVRSEGGPCRMEGAPKELFGGVRVAVDGTRFVFLHNTDPDNPFEGYRHTRPGCRDQTFGADVQHRPERQQGAHRRRRGLGGRLVAGRPHRGEVRPAGAGMPRAGDTCRQEAVAGRVVATRTAAAVAAVAPARGCAHSVGVACRGRLRPGRLDGAAAAGVAVGSRR